ncbi:hypothetical protein F5B20DRAFT_575861 [Whalleya microplaca]|nr:hypothetical protein F5B20DRAFT_575861 [Whalleya microplaca]
MPNNEHVSSSSHQGFKKKHITVTILKMFFAKALALFIAATAPLTLAAPANETVAQDGYWAQFCNDDDCTVDCGMSVDVANPGCLNEFGRKSIKFHGGGHHDFAMVASPSGDCPCQRNCASIPTNTHCWNITQFSGAQSFRFISGRCDSNNC